MLEARKVNARVLLFGSWASGTSHAGSDIDVAVLSDLPLPTGWLAELRERIEESHVPYRVDLVDLSETSPEFRQRVLLEATPWSA